MEEMRMRRLMWGREGTGPWAPGDISCLLQECLNAAQLLGDFVTSSGHTVSWKVLFSTQYFI